MDPLGTGWETDLQSWSQFPSAAQKQVVVLVFFFPSHCAKFLPKSADEYQNSQQPRDDCVSEDSWASKWIQFYFQMHYLFLAKLHYFHFFHRIWILIIKKKHS